MFGNTDRPNTDRIGRFLLLDILGVGGFATVYRADDTELGREVAIKLLHPHLALDQLFVRRFRAEARAAARLREPHIVTVYDVGATDNGRTYLVMELLSGTPLSKLIARDAPFSVERAVMIVDQLGVALDYVHSQGLVHRDLKPANVMVLDGDAVKLMDFGVARSLDDQAHLTSTGQTIGSPIYMSPEQIASEHIGPETDVYALGILTYELFARRPPFVGSPSMLMDQHRFAPPPALRQFNPAVPEAAVEVIERALAKDPSKRPATAGTFAAQLAESLSIDRPAIHAGVTPVRRGFLSLPRAAVRDLGTSLILGPTTQLIRTRTAPAAEPAPVTPEGARREDAMAPARAAPTPRHPLLFAAKVAAPLLVLLIVLLALLYQRSNGATRGSKAAVVVPAPATVAPTSAATTPTPAPPLKLAVSGLKICDDPTTCTQTDFIASATVSACFTIAPGDDGHPLAAVTTVDRPDPPADAADSSVVARSDAIQQMAADGCYAMKVLAGPLTEGPYAVWVLHDTDVLARAGFHAVAAPTPAPEPTAEPAPAPAPAQAQPTQRPAVSQPQPIQPAQSAPQPVRTAAPAPAPPATAPPRAIPTEAPAATPPPRGIPPQN